MGIRFGYGRHMKTVDPGHLYVLDHLDGEGTSLLRFVKRVGENFPGNEEPAYEGVTLQEVLRAMIDRVKYVSNQQHWQENDDVLTSLRDALYKLELRAAKVRQEVKEFLNVNRSNTMWIEELPVCNQCGHVACGRHP